LPVRVAVGPCANIGNTNDAKIKAIKNLFNWVPFSIIFILRLRHHQAKRRGSMEKE
jgi:hypothetical protein